MDDAAGISLLPKDDEVGLQAEQLMRRLLETFFYSISTRQIFSTIATLLGHYVLNAFRCSIVVG